jgi:hypothetical protein
MYLLYLGMGGDARTPASSLLAFDLQERYEKASGLY